MFFIDLEEYISNCKFWHFLKVMIGGENMREYEENVDYANDDEDEETICSASYIDGFENTEEDVGILNFDMEKSEAKMLIESLFEVVTEMRDIKTTKSKLLKIIPNFWATQQNVDEILNYAVESELLEIKDGYYIRIN